MAKSDDTEEQKVTGVQDIQDALESVIDAEGEDQDELEEEDQDNQDDDDHNDDSEEDDDSDSEEDDSQDDEDDSDDDDSDDSDEDDSAGDDDDSKGERRFSQFKGDGSDEDYLKNLEEGYAKSSTEGQRLSQELKETNRRLEAINRVLSSNPDMAEALRKAMGENPQGDSKKKDDNRDPFLRNSEREWREKSEKEAQEFIDANPEVLSDPKVNEDVKKWMRIFSQAELEENDRLMTAGEAMAKAYDYLGLENKMKSKTELASKAKKAAAPTRPQPAKKKSKSTSKEFTDQQLDYARRMGISKEILSKYNK